MKWKRSKKAHQEAKAKAADERKKAKAKLMQQVSTQMHTRFKPKKKQLQRKSVKPPAHSYSNYKLGRKSKSQFHKI